MLRQISRQFGGPGGVIASKKPEKRPPKKFPIVADLLR
jgi:hypothetical protein